MKETKQRWRHLAQVQPPLGRSLLLYAPELRGARGVADDGVRLGVRAGGRGHGRLKAVPHEKGILFLRWWAYPVPPRVDIMRAPRLALTPDMRMAVDKLESAVARGRLKRGAAIDHLKLDIKLYTLNALLRRRLIRRNQEFFYVL